VGPSRRRRKGAPTFGRMIEATALFLRSKGGVILGRQEVLAKSIRRREAIDDAGTGTNQAGRRESRAPGPARSEIGRLEVRCGRLLSFTLAVNDLQDLAGNRFGTQPDSRR
jgi:hypothetical protein